MVTETGSIETTSSHVLIGLGLVYLDHVTLEQPEGCGVDWEFLSNMIN